MSEGRCSVAGTWSGQGAAATEASRWTRAPARLVWGRGGGSRVCVCLGWGPFAPFGIGASDESTSTARASLAGGQPVEAFPGLGAAAAPCSGTRVFCGSCLSLLY